MPKIRILTESELRRAIALNLDTVACIESAFVALSGGKVVMPPILSLAVHDYNGEIDVKTAYVPGVDSIALKMSPGFFDNPRIGLPSTSGLMVLFSARTGQVEALLLDNGYLTDVRTASAGAVSARHLSREDSSKALIVGAGVQARLQLEALTLVRPIREAAIWARDMAKAEAAAREVAEKLGIPVSATGNLGAAATTADIIVTTTPSTTPLIEAEWLRPGQHVTAMGSDQPYKNELEAECLRRAHLFVPDRLSQSAVLGELRSAIEAGIVAREATFAELGDIVAGKAPGRPSPDAITISDLTGTGVQDTAIATLARQRTEAAGAGTIIES